MRRIQAAAWLIVGGVLSLQTPAIAEDDRAAELLVQARVALGGDKLEAVKSLSATGEFRRMFGDREINGDLTIDLAAPDRIKRTEEMGFGGGPAMIRVAALDAGEFWEDATNRGGFMARMGPGGGPAEVTAADRERFRQMQQRRLEGELQRFLLVWLLRSSAPVTYAGTAEAEDGVADVLEVKGDAPSAVRLFLDAQTHQPLMLTYEGVLPRMRFRDRRGPPPPREANAPPQEPPPLVTFELRFDDYRAVDGIMLPHRLTQSVDSKAVEEWTINRFKVNPAFKPDAFTKK